MAHNPKVSVVSISYNQEKFIREALEGFVVQKTDFKFEVIIADDCSKDNTAKIIEEYAHKYPNIIKPILRKKNVGVSDNLFDAMRQAKGDYIALCEGDDYWTDPLKLQKQADFLDNNPDYALCFHPVKVFFEDSSKKDYVYPDSAKKQEFTVKELLKGNFIQTNSVMYRRRSYENMPNNILPLDWYIHLYHAQFGKIGFIDNVMSAYRRHPGGIWWDSYKNIDRIWQKHGVKHLSMFVEAQKLYKDNKNYRDIVQPSIIKMFERLIETDNKYRSSILEDAVIAEPESVDYFIKYQAQKLQEKEQIIQKNLREIKQILHDKDHEIYKKERDIALIKSSRIWRLRNFIAKLVGKPQV